MACVTMYNIIRKENASTICKVEGKQVDSKFECVPSQCPTLVVWLIAMSLGTMPLSGSIWGWVLPMHVTESNQL